MRVASKPMRDVDVVQRTACNNRLPRLLRTHGHRRGVREVTLRYSPSIDDAAIYASTRLSTLQRFCLIYVYPTSPSSIPPHLYVFTGSSIVHVAVLRLRRHISRLAFPCTSHFLASRISIHLTSAACLSQAGSAPHPLNLPSSSLSPT